MMFISCLLSWLFKGKKLTASAVKETVSNLDSIVDDISSDGVVDLPETEADLGHIIAAVELDDGRHCEER